MTPAPDEATGAGGIPSLPRAVAQVLAPDGTVVGVGFLVSERLLVTCAHVVEAAGKGPGDRVEVVFPHAAGPAGGSSAGPLEGEVLDGPWRAPTAEDISVVALSAPPAGVAPLPLGSAAGTRGHHVRSFGFPAQAPPDGHFGFGIAGELLPGTGGTGPHLQLTDANDLTTGFSGGPVLDEVTGLVIGMLTEITGPDVYARGQGIAYVTPTEVLREVVPELAIQEICPYRGLEPFTADQARWFEGRQEAVRHVVASLGRQRRLTLLLGPSGSGKSSLVQAGVLRALAEGALAGSDRWAAVLARPRQDPMAELERAGLPGAATDGLAEAVTRRLAADPGIERVLLVIDQFEELFTHPGAGGPQQHRLPLAQQITTTVGTHPELSVILVMRDDFYPQLAAQAPGLLKAAMPGLLNVPNTLDRGDLHDIIVRPALDVGARFQAGLPEQIVMDVLATDPDGPTTGQVPATVLPLLELTLSQLWQRRQDGYLTHEAYRRIGAVSGSLTLWCDAAVQRLPAGQRPIAQRVLTSLVRPADPSRQAPAVRAQVPLDDLRDLAGDPDAPAGPDGAHRDVDEVIAALTRHRVITTQTAATAEGSGGPPGRPVAELIHDALIRDWGTLREWIDQDHRFQEWLDRTRERRTRWAEQQDPGDLLAGTALAEGLEWSRQRRLPGDISAFLTTSRQRQQAAVRRSRRLNAVLATLLALALLAAGGALWQWRTAVTAREAAQSRQLAAQSSELIGTNPELASLLAVQAYRTHHNAESLAALRNAAALPKHRRLAGHTDSVRAEAFSPDGGTLATVSDDRTLRLWNVAQGTEKAVRTGHTGEVYAVAFASDGRTVATAGADRTVRLWNAEHGTYRTVRGETKSTVDSVAFSPDGKTLATAGLDGYVQLWDVRTGAPGRTLSGHGGQVTSVAFSPDGQTLASGGADTEVLLWDVADGRLRRKLSGHKGQVNDVAFSRDGHTLASVGGEGVLKLWDPATGENRSYQGEGTVRAVAFSPDGRTIATGSDNVVQLWDAATGVALTGLIGHTDSVYDVAFSPGGATLASCGSDHSVRLWDMTRGVVRAAQVRHKGAVMAAAFSRDGSLLATVSLDGTIRVSDARGGAMRDPWSVNPGSLLAVEFSPDGATLATGDIEGTVRLWDVATGRNTKSWTEHEDQVNAVAFSPDGSRLATAAADSTVLVWDLRAGKLHTALAGHKDAVNAVVFSRDGATLATGSGDGTVGLWDADTGDNLAFLRGHTQQVSSVAFSPDGRTLASASYDRTVRLWNVGSRTTRATLLGHTGEVTRVVFSPDGKTVASAGIEATARLWDAGTGKPLVTLTGHSGAVFALAFSPDGGTLVTGGFDSVTRLWDTVLPRPDAAVAAICKAVNRDLTTEERTAYLPGHSATDAVCPAG
ncbi:trypsin-like peptidase domain-containing protein [Streptomyces sp. NPDC127069]|uniref:nSTAND1 domain-containing NTPase n=1 Tax=Streptomyces sp. NPDC127069 TaxID=3347128 RepID=UPI0036517D1A